MGRDKRRGKSRGCAVGNSEEGFGSDRDAWHAGLELIRLLWAQRALRHHAGRALSPQELDDHITRFCRKLRNGPAFLGLSKVQREGRLDNEGLVAVLFVIAGVYGISGGSTRSAEVAFLAHGFDPRSITEFHQRIIHGRGVGRLLKLSGVNVLPTERLARLLWSRLDGNALHKFKSEVAKVPVKKQPGARQDEG